MMYFVPAERRLPYTIVSARYVAFVMILCSARMIRVRFAHVLALV